MNIDKLIKLSKKPELFKRSNAEFWNDPHISKKMLEAHLNPDWDAASRKLETIDASVKWLSENILPNQNIKILDLGCGPGLYASRLAKRDYFVTGIDYSQRSINYAKKKVEEDKLDIKYIYQNYLTIDFEDEFDVIMLIYCDLGALINKERDILLEKVYQALKPGGIFIFDIFTDKNRDASNLRRSWEVAEDGFWSKKPYLALTETFLYPDEDTFLDQTIVMTDDKEINIYRIFDHFYTKETITDLLDKFGFRDHSYYSDLVGREYSRESKTLAIVTNK
ncbi:class I SAM-dependent methyltransferase [Halonatronum saccharophilum]|uniref:class I SAM-dependent methyltransferase n=1 Tax=Halonatronum saccharophilum TaxID=150060 RepID=UPI0004B95E2E|nr:class I SAM-dependent methyltransferase [Halonatronum saccharophilum]